MKKENASFRQIHAVEDELRRIIKEAREQFDKENHPPTWEENREWERKHPSPQDKYDAKKKAKFEVIRGRADCILFNAKAEKTTADEMLAVVEKFRKELLG